LLLACDTPMLRSETIRELSAAHERSALATMAITRDDSGEYAEPTLAVYEPTIVPMLQRLMLEKGGSFQPLLNEAGVRKWPLTEGQAREMMNVNTEEDLRRALAKV